jgi:hypothetical protein
MTTPDDDEDITPEAHPDSREVPLTTDPDQQTGDEDLDPTRGEGGAG